MQKYGKGTVHKFNHGWCFVVKNVTFGNFETRRNCLINFEFEVLRKEKSCKRLYIFLQVFTTFIYHRQFLCTTPNAAKQIFISIFWSEAVKEKWSLHMCSTAELSVLNRWFEMEMLSHWVAVPLNYWQLCINYSAWIYSILGILEYFRIPNIRQVPTRTLKCIKTGLSFILRNIREQRMSSKNKLKFFL